MRRKRKYYDFYIECMATGFMPKMGLCNNFPKNHKLELFKPTIEDVYENEIHIATWGYFLRSCPGEQEDAFNTIRQTVVLFLAAMNNEL